MENKNGQGIFYGVIGVATLVVAIIGATFAYFNASASANYVNNIAGNTLELTGGALSVSVTKLNLGGTAPVALVPATIANESGTPTVAGINQALTAHCEKNGYTGCHVYKIQASATTTIAEAAINLATLTTTNTKNKSDWKYVIYKGTDSTCTSVVNSGNMDLSSPVNMHATDKVLSSTPTIYYLMIYLAEDSGVQNDGGNNDATGSYSGTVTLTAGAGSVTANFTQS